MELKEHCEQLINHIKLLKSSVSSMSATGKVIISLMGGPGSGKGTVSEAIRERYDVGYMSAGDLLRKAALTDEWLAEQLRNGVIVPQEITIGLLKKEIESQQKEFYLIDGFPRKVEQSDAFESIVGPFTAMLFLEVPDDELVSRLQGRSVSSGRSDDNPESIRQRITVFHSVSYPVRQHFEKKQKIHVIDGNRSKEAVKADVLSILESILKPQ